MNQQEQQLLREIAQRLNSFLKLFNGLLSLAILHYLVYLAYTISTAL